MPRQERFTDDEPAGFHRRDCAVFRFPPDERFDKCDCKDNAAMGRARIAREKNVAKETKPAADRVMAPRRHRPYLQTRDDT